VVDECRLRRRLVRIRLAGGHDGLLAEREGHFDAAELSRVLELERVKERGERGGGEMRGIQLA